MSVEPSILKMCSCS